MALVVLIVGFQFIGVFHDLLIQGMLDALLDGNHNGLVHLVRDDHANPRLAESSLTHIVFPPSRSRLGRGLALAEHGFDSGNVALDFADLHRVFQLVGGVLKAQIKQVLFQLAELRGKLFAGKVTDFLALHHASPPSTGTSRLTNFDLQGSL
ncbi:hypothetical protein SDC9_196384 [bioreactor metagenome]|uniref:Uncharacterized protein n=1 Tax=bioreactor metagenome TaxID=1076179 RepID=A0A645ID71_9ZZZZ